MSKLQEPVDRVLEIERLARLEPIDYEAARTEAAKRLGVRAKILDREVTDTRRALRLDGEIDDGQGRAAKIADVLPWHEPLDGDQIATMLAAAVKTYAVVPDHAADVIAIWVLHTWLVNMFTMSPRLAITSPTKGCGKTTILRVLNKVTRRPRRAGSISPPALFRAVEQFQPTLLLDETEKYVEYGSDLHALLNEGHCKGGTVMRVLGEKLELREFSVFGAVAFAHNGHLPDDLEQRSIIIEMQRRRADEQLEDLPDDRAGSFEIIARKCARWAGDNAGELDDVDPDMVGLINRTADNWRPLFAIADLIGSDWPHRIREAAAKLAPRESESVGPMLLADIKALFDHENTDKLWSEDICKALAAMEGRPWAEFGMGRKPISKNQLARLLDGFHVKPASVRQRDRTQKGYYRHQFEELWQRYVDGPEAHETAQRHTATLRALLQPL
jgi:putative DNA primase/helicase